MFGLAGLEFVGLKEARTSRARKHCVSGQVLSAESKHTGQASLTSCGEFVCFIYTRGITSLIYFHSADGLSALLLKADFRNSNLGDGKLEGRFELITESEKLEILNLDTIWQQM